MADPFFTSAAHDLLKVRIEPLPQLIMTTRISEAMAALSSIIAMETNILLVADHNTWGALGHAAYASLAVNAHHQHLHYYIYDKPPLPDHIALATLDAQCAAHSPSLLIAIGSGTINDLCKYASARRGIGYIVLPTAPSMNGYTSVNASLALDDHKSSYQAQLPKAVICCMEVIARAPIRLIRAGFGDSLARSTAQADWLLSHLLLGTTYDKTPFTLTEPYEQQVLTQAEKLGQHDTATIASLMRLLLLSGFGMTMAGGSYPASQGEHMIAHAYEMLYPNEPHPYHGEQIAVTTLTMARLQEHMLGLSCPPDAGVLRSSRRAVAGLGPQLFGADDDTIYHAKRSRMGDISAFHAKLKSQWETITIPIRAIMCPASQLEAAALAAGLGITPESIGWKQKHYTQALSIAPFTRNRFTFLDLIPA